MLSSIGTPTEVTVRYALLSNLHFMINQALSTYTLARIKISTGTDRTLGACKCSPST